MKFGGEMVKPTHADAEILLKLVELEQSDRMIRAQSWFWGEFAEKDFEEFQKEYPSGSEGDNYSNAIIDFWETVGVLLRYKLINEYLLFGRFWDVESYWERLQPVIYGMREAYEEPEISENFEWLAKRAAKWRKSHKRKV
jgi:hypothetical protein